MDPECVSQLKGHILTCKCLPLYVFGVPTEVGRVVNLVLEKLHDIRLLLCTNCNGNQSILTMPVTKFPMKLGGWLALLLSKRK